jgi:hypothetical protein
MTEEELDVVIGRARGEKRPPRVLVTGSREWADPEPIRRALALLPPDAVVIHGMARGADRLAHHIAAELGLAVWPRPAMWERGKAAGLIRNREMLENDRPDLVLAFLPKHAAARGTRHMVEIARRAGVLVLEYVGDGP